MRNFLLLLVMIISSQSYSQNTSKLVIYRPGQFAGAGVNFSIYVDDEKVCKISNNKHIEIELPAGEVSLRALNGGVELFKKTTALKVTIEEGKTHYVACNIKSSITRFRMEMSEVVKSTADRDMAKTSLDNCQLED